MFDRYHTDTLYKVFFISVSQVLSRAHEDYAAHWRFLVSLVGVVCGKGENNSSHITISQTKSCMVLIRLMATNNNNEDEPRITALER